MSWIKKRVIWKGNSLSQLKALYGPIESDPSQGITQEKSHLPEQALLVKNDISKPGHEPKGIIVKKHDKSQ